MRELIISKNEANQRLDKYLAKYLNQAPTSFIYKMLRKKNIVLNGKKAAGKEKLQAGDSVKLFLAEDTIEKFIEQKHTVRKRLPGHMPEVIYEDADVLLLNKPAGMLSQKANPSDVSVVDYITEYLLRSGQVTETDLHTFHPGICNRLDRNTSGLIAAGKSLAGLQELSLGFYDRTFRKYYHCLVKGKVDKQIHLNGYLKKDHRTNRVTVIQESETDAQPIETEYRPLESNGKYTLLEVHLITGKTHQIRAHLASAGHPLIGDYKYGDRSLNDRFREKYGLKSQLLHAYRLEFPELDGALKEVSGRTFIAEEPILFQKIAKDCIR